MSEVKSVLVDLGATAADTVTAAVHQHTPGARLCFNTGPTNSVAAVQRWI